MLTAWKDDLRPGSTRISSSARATVPLPDARASRPVGATSARTSSSSAAAAGSPCASCSSIPASVDPLVDLDPEMTALLGIPPRALNQVRCAPEGTRVNDDAFVWLDRHADMFDFVVVDFPDPNNHGVGKLYTRRLPPPLAAPVARRPRRRAGDIAALRRRATGASPRRRRLACARTRHLYVPSFGGGVRARRARRRQLHAAHGAPAGLRYLTVAEVPRMFEFSADMQPVPSSEPAQHAGVGALLRAGVGAGESVTSREERVSVVMRT